jgi:hypothetical protein
MNNPVIAVGTRDWSLVSEFQSVDTKEAYLQGQGLEGRRLLDKLNNKMEENPSSWI